MEVITTLLLFIGLAVMWIAQRKEKKGAEERKKILKPEGNTTESIVQDKLYTDLSTDEDLRERHLTGSLVEEEDSEESVKISTRDKLSRMSELKKAIVWAEILDKPVCDRYNGF